RETGDRCVCGEFFPPVHSCRPRAGSAGPRPFEGGGGHGPLWTSRRRGGPGAAGLGGIPRPATVLHLALDCQPAFLRRHVEQEPGANGRWGIQPRMAGWETCPTNRAGRRLRMAVVCEAAPTI